MELNVALVEQTEEPDYLESDHTRPSMEEDFPNFRSFQIVKMVKHFRVITDGSDQRLRLGFKCKTCGHTFNKTMQLLGHIRMHFEDEHTCRECGKYFFDPNKLSTHIKAKHTVSMVKCQLGCTKFTTTTFKCLQLHYERYHFVKIRMREMRKMDEAIRNGGTVMTEVVNNQPKRKRSRRGQLKINDEESEESLEEVAAEQAEPEQRPEPAEPPDGMPAGSDGEIITDEYTVSDQMQCCVCGAIFGNEQQLELHESTHTSPFECSFCETEFLQLEEIREHYQSKHQMVGSATQFVITSTHPGSQLQVQQSQPHQMQQHHHHHQLQLQHQQHPQQQVHHIAPTAQFIPNQNPGTMTTMLVMQNGMLIPVQTIDSSQLAAVNSFPQTSITQIGQNQIAWPITATPITSNHHPQAQQVLPPVHNQIEIIPLHGPAPVTQAGTPVSAVCIAPQHLQAAGAGGSYVINSIASIDPSYLKQVDAVTVQQHQQHQQQQHQQQQQQQQQHQQQQQFQQQLQQQQYHT